MKSSPAGRRRAWPRAAAAVAAALLAACGDDPAPDDAPASPPQPVEVRSAEDVVAGARVARLDPGTLNDAEIDRMIGAGARCAFRYTGDGAPVFVVGLKADGSLARGVIKLDRSLVALQPDDAAGAATLAMAAGPLRVAVPAAQQVAAARRASASVDAAMVFGVGSELEVGYAGYLACRPAAAAPAGG